MTWEEFQQMKYSIYESNAYEETDIVCPDCGQPLHINTSIVYTSNPPQHEYICLECGWEGIE
jgi:predicted RNA-binding Zn-ribbon protein involved in translation (DUF1610 family)